MKILILGGTGAIGEQLVNLLDASCNEIYVTSRRRHKDYGKVHFLYGNAHSMEFLKDVLNNDCWDIVIDFMVYSTSEFHERMEHLLNLAKIQYIFLSSSRVYADTSKLITEQTKRHLDISTDKIFLMSDDYPITKARQEDMLLNSKHTNWTIIRPYITFSESRLQLGVFEKEIWLWRALHGKKIVFSNDMANKYTTLTYANDVAKGILKIIGNEKAYRQIVQMATSQTLLWKDVLQMYLDIIEDKLGFRPEVVYCNSLDVMSFSIMNSYSVKYDRLYDRKFDSSKFLSICEGKFEFSDVNVKLKECLNHFIDCSDDKKYREIPLSTQAYLDRIAGEITPIREIEGIKKKTKYIFFRFTPFYTINVKRKMRKKYMRRHCEGCL